MVCMHFHGGGGNEWCLQVAPDYQAFGSGGDSWGCGGGRLHAPGCMVKGACSENLQCWWEVPTSGVQDGCSGLNLPSYPTREAPCHLRVRACAEKEVSKTVPHSLISHSPTMALCFPGGLRLPPTLPWLWCTTTWPLQAVSTANFSPLLGTYLGSPSLST